MIFRSPQLPAYLLPKVQAAVTFVNRTVGSQTAYKLRHYQGRTFVIVEFEGFRVEFRHGPDRVD
jgi:hypothetical protein